MLRALLTPSFLALIAASHPAFAQSASSGGEGRQIDRGAYISQVLRAHSSDYKACFKNVPAVANAPGVATTVPDTPQSDPDAPAEIVIALDSAGSMGAKLDTGRRIDAAKRAIADFTSTLPSGVKVSVIAFGDQGSYLPEGRTKSCSAGAHVVAPLGSAAAASQAAAKLQPAGWTPLTAAIAAAPATFSQAPQLPRLFIIIADGVDTCGNDAAAAMRAVAASPAGPAAIIIGVGAIGEIEQQNLRAVAEAGRGRLELARSSAEIGRAMRLAAAQAKIPMVERKPPASATRAAAPAKSRNAAPALMAAVNCVGRNSNNDQSGALQQIASDKEAGKIDGIIADSAGNAVAARAERTNNLMLDYVDALREQDGAKAASLWSQFEEGMR